MGQCSTVLNKQVFSLKGCFDVNMLQKYFNYRQGLIDQYVKGDMTKNEYLKKNLEAVLSLNISPFKNADTVDKALFNYQYYNAMAKDAKIEASYAVNKEYAYTLREKADYFYSKKDNATLKILKLLDFKGVEAYFISVKSKYLKGKLFEIVLKEYYNMILHSSSPVILNILREERAFDEHTKKSLIDGYINQRYY